VSNEPTPSRSTYGALRTVARRAPWLRRAARRFLVALIRLAGRPRKTAFDRPDHLRPELLLEQTDQLNEAAEHYFADYSDPEFILGKPFTEAENFPKRLFDLGVLFHSLRLTPHNVVLELGAGTCWLSHFLNRYGCKTVSVDVSKTAVDLGRELFERDGQTRWDLEPEFIAYDGRRIPLPDASCDKIVINDAFHHLPNPEEILREMARLLPQGGIVAMSEPGPGHAESEESLREVRETGVLENEIVLSELEEMALRAGFTEVALVPLVLDAVQEIPVSKLGKAEEAEAILDQWLRLGRGTRYIVLHKGRWLPTTQAPGRLDARIEIVGSGGSAEVPLGAPFPLRVRVTNRGDTRWLATIYERVGWTRLGVHLYRATGALPGELVDFDWLRASLPFDMEPGDEATVEVELPPIAEPGSYRLVFDLVAEGVLWFAQKDSPTAELTLEVV